MAADVVSPQVLSDVQYLPLCGGLTVIGLIVTVLVYRRRGLLAGARMLAWSLIPLALALVGAARAVWQVIDALLNFAVHLTFSPVSWVGAALLVLCIVLFVVTGAVSSRRLHRGRPATDTPPSIGAPVRTTTRSAKASSTAPTAPTANVPAIQRGTKTARPAADPEMDEIAEILKQRGIN